MEELILKLLIDPYDESLKIHKINDLIDNYNYMYIFRSFIKVNFTTLELTKYILYKILRNELDNGLKTIIRLCEYKQIPINYDAIDYVVNVLKKRNK